jgi:hypothetical protein
LPVSAQQGFRDLIWLRSFRRWQLTPRWSQRRLRLELVFDDEGDLFGGECLETVRTPIFTLFQCRNPPPNSVRYFGASELLEQVQDRVWLAKVTNAVNQHWQRQNSTAKSLC